MQTLQKRLAWKMGLKRGECTDDEQEEIDRTIILEQTAFLNNFCLKPWKAITNWSTHPISSEQTSTL